MVRAALEPSQTRGQKRLAVNALQRTILVRCSFCTLYSSTCAPRRIQTLRAQGPSVNFSMALSVHPKFADANRERSMSPTLTEWAYCSRGK